jgi:hypothetical protein
MKFREEATMSLFFIQHQHRDDTCPASNADMARGLAGHISPENAAKFGVKVHADCVLPGEHTLYLVVEAEDPEKVATFITPFLNVGSVSIKPAITCEVVAARASDS